MPAPGDEATPGEVFGLLVGWAALVAYGWRGYRMRVAQTDGAPVARWALLVAGMPWTALGVWVFLDYGHASWWAGAAACALWVAAAASGIWRDLLLAVVPLAGLGALATLGHLARSAHGLDAWLSGSLDAGVAWSAIATIVLVTRPAQYP